MYGYTVFWCSPLLFEFLSRAMYLICATCAMHLQRPEGTHVAGQVNAIRREPCTALFGADQTAQRFGYAPGNRAL